MDITQLTLILRNDKFTRGMFQGVYPSDLAACKCFTLPSPVYRQCGYEWQARFTLGFTKEQEGEFFHSYGSPPSKYSRTFTTFLNKNSSHWTFNTVTLQGIYSNVCGHYCLYFALYRSRQISMSTIVHRFSKDTSKNDSLVKRFIEKHFPISFPKYRTDANKEQKLNTKFSKKTPCNFFSTHLIEWAK